MAPAVPFYEVGQADDATAALILDVQITDAQVFASSTEVTGKGKAKEGEQTDLQLALSLHQDEVRRMRGIVTDRIVSRRLHVITGSEGIRRVDAATGNVRQISGPGRRRGHIDSSTAIASSSRNTNKVLPIRPASSKSQSSNDQTSKDESSNARLSKAESSKPKSNESQASNVQIGTKQPPTVLSTNDKTRIVESNNENDRGALNDNPKVKIKDASVSEGAVATSPTPDSQLGTSKNTSGETSPGESTEEAADKKTDGKASEQDKFVESSKWAASRKVPETVTCLLCDLSTPLAGSLQLSCDHRYCLGCLEELYRRCTIDEGLFPPRCCSQPIPWALAEPYLSSDLKELFQEKAVEFSTPKRVYCSASSCSAFIPRESIVLDKAQCQKCGQETCTICNTKAHIGDCPEDSNIKQVLDLASKEGWQRCPGCKRMTELTIGCNHIV